MGAMLHLVCWMRVLPFLLFAPALLTGQSPLRPTTTSLNRTRAQLREEISGARALATTAFVAQYWRIPGNAGFNASLARVAAILDSAGYEE